MARATDTSRRDARLDRPKGLRSNFTVRIGGGSGNSSDRFGRFSESFARAMGTTRFLFGLTAIVIVWLVYNSVVPRHCSSTPRGQNFTLLTLILSLQASYAAPLILLAQNRQDDRDRVQIEQDRQRAERNLADTEYLAREVVSLRLAMKDMATKDFIRAELRALLDELDGSEKPDKSTKSVKPPKASREDVAVTSELLLAALARVQDPEIRRPITELDMVRSATVDAGVASIDVRLTIVGCPAADRIEADVRAAAASVPGVTRVELTLGVMTVAEREALTTRLRGTRAQQFGPDSLTKIFAISSGKGGVGKSTVTANLAVALAARGLRVGLVDADVFGFSIPGILGIAGVTPTQLGEMILPPVAHGVKVISIGMFVDGQAAVSWRGPLLHRTIQQFLTDVFFGDLDILLLDLPPGTGDIAISLGQLLPQAEVIVVTTPQPAAAEVAERSGIVARQTGQTVIGVVENMTGLPQPDGSVLELFGHGGGDELAARLDVPVLARIPLSLALREGGDIGVPIVLGNATREPGVVEPAAASITQLAALLATRARGLAGRSLPFSSPG